MYSEEDRRLIGTLNKTDPSSSITLTALAEVSNVCFAILVARSIACVRAASVSGSTAARLSKTEMITRHGD